MVGSMWFGRYTTCTSHWTFSSCCCSQTKGEMMRRVVISGLGVVSPVGIGKEVFWQNLLDGISGAKALDDVTCCRLFGHHAFGAQVVCEVPHFTPETQHVPPAYQEVDRSLPFAFTAV